jgi:hypothetical protein
MSLPSYTGDGAAKSCWRCSCRDDISCGMMSLSSHAGDGVTESMLAVV